MKKKLTFILLVLFLLKITLVYAEYHSGGYNEYKDWYTALEFEQNGDTKSALALYDKLIKQKEFVPAMFMRADVSMRYGNDAFAIGLLEKAKKIDPQQVFLYKRLANAYFRSKNLKQADKNIIKYLSLYSMDRSAKQLKQKIKSSLGSDYYKKQNKIARKKRKELDVKVTRFARGDLPEVKVAVASGVNRFELKGTQDVAVYASGKKVFTAKAGVLYDVCLWAGNLVVKEESKELLNVSMPVEFYPQSETGLLGVFDVEHGRGDYWMGKLDSFFRGYLRCIKVKDAFTVVNVVNVEEYVYGVLPSEMFASWPMEALKAQAVLARTLALKRKGRSKKYGYDFENSTRTQVYLGVKKEKDRAIDAVDQTRGVIVVHNNKPAEIFFSSNDGGHSVENGFGLSYYKGIKDKNIKALTFPLNQVSLIQYLHPNFESFSSPGGKSASTYRWQRFFLNKDLANFLNDKGYPCTRVQSIKVLVRNKSGHVEKIAIQTDKGRYTIQNELKIRNALGKLRSSLFRIEEVKLEDQVVAFLFWGGGFGHGVGMSQYGAKGMAKKGYIFKDILRHYYPYFELRKIYK